MIRWSELDIPINQSLQRRWRMEFCPYAIRETSGACLGLGNGEDDEPCEICKACDRLGIEVGDET